MSSFREIICMSHHLYVFNYKLQIIYLCKSVNQYRMYDLFAKIYEIFAIIESPKYAKF